MAGFRLDSELSDVSLVLLVSQVLAKIDRIRPPSIN